MLWMFAAHIKSLCAWFGLVRFGLISNAEILVAYILRCIIEVSFHFIRSLSIFETENISCLNWFVVSISTLHVCFMPFCCCYCCCCGCCRRSGCRSSRFTFVSLAMFIFSFLLVYLSFYCPYSWCDTRWHLPCIYWFPSFTNVLSYCEFDRFRSSNIIIICDGWNNDSRNKHLRQFYSFRTILPEFFFFRCCPRFYSVRRQHISC